MNRRDRTLVIIGGHEDKQGDRVILREIAGRIGSGKLVITAVASDKPDALYEEYDHVFRALGIPHVYRLCIETREDAKTSHALKTLDDASGIFFSGGDQLKITSQIGDTPVFQRIREIYDAGGLVAGTSAGASAMCETMLVGGNGKESHKINESLQLAPGLGLMQDAIIDQHFAERGRMGRLIGAIAQNPKNLGIGIDENTAIIVEGERRFHVLGEGAVYVLNAVDVSYSNIDTLEADKALSIHDLRLDVLSEGDRFDLANREPQRLSKRQLRETTNNH
jgi:cyanophycinase